MWILPKNRANANSSSLSPERKDETNWGDGGVLTSGKDGNGHGVTRRGSGSGQMGGAVTAQTACGRTQRARGALVL